MSGNGKWLGAWSVAALLLVSSGQAEAKRRPRAAAPRQAAASAPATAPSSVETPRGAVPASQIPRRGEAAPVNAAAGGRDVVQRESHIEFDERLIQGQAASGAIYLFQRGSSDFHSMVRLPDSFRDRTVRQILPATQKQ